MQTLDMKKGNYLKAEPTITLNPGQVKCLSNIPPGYFLVFDASGQISTRSGGTSHGENYSTAEESCQGGVKK